MNKKLFHYIIPIFCLIIIGLQFIRVRLDGLSRWKGGGFGMYAEVHYSKHEVRVSYISIPIDTIIKNNEQIKKAIDNLKLIPSDKNLYNTAQLIQEYTQNDSIGIQVWKPYIDHNKSFYSRELINEVNL